MSAMGIPISQQAAALRIIGATTSEPRSSACTGPTVVASSPVPSHALEITPVRTQRCNWMSCSRARSSPAYSASLASAERPETTAARSESASIVARYACTSAGSGFQLTYSGGSNGGDRCISLHLLFDPSEQAAAPRARLGRGGERLGELECRQVAVVGVRLHRLGERLLEAGRDVGPQLTQRHRRASQAGGYPPPGGSAPGRGAPRVHAPPP